LRKVAKRWHCEERTYERGTVTSYICEKMSTVNQEPQAPVNAQGSHPAMCAVVATGREE
jgi:hypothetical protein